MNARLLGAKSSVVVLVFLVIRVVLLVVREPFFDELFTVWMARRPVGEIIPALLLDSGPPLYYFVARLTDVVALRALALLFATGALMLILTRRSLGNARYVAAALLAFYPPAALFAVDARAYALCGLFVAFGAIAIREARPFVAAGAMLLAAYTHWYGALFLPLILLAGWRGVLPSRRTAQAPEAMDSGGQAILPVRSPPSEARSGQAGLPVPHQFMSGEAEGSPSDARDTLPRQRTAGRRLHAAIAFVAACLLFVPGLMLARKQPVEAMGWLGDSNPAEALQAFAFVGRYAESLFAPAPMFLVVLSAIVTVVAIVRNWTFAPMVLVPVVLATAFALAGRGVYFPMRFESVLAVPLVLWLATSLERWPPRVRLALTTILCTCGAAAMAIGAVDHHARPVDAYRQAASRLKGDEPVVASGYLYLEAVHQLGSDRVRAYPAEQASHPGWRVSATAEPLPEGRFLWIVERGAPELKKLPGRPQVVYANDRAVILRVANP